MQDMFQFEVESVKELGLAANTPSPLARLQWKTEGKPHSFYSVYNSFYSVKSSGH